MGYNERMVLLSNIERTEIESKSQPGVSLDVQIASCYQI